MEMEMRQAPTLSRGAGHCHIGRPSSTLQEWQMPGDVSSRWNPEQVTVYACISKGPKKGSNERPDAGYGLSQRRISYVPFVM